MQLTNKIIQEYDSKGKCNDLSDNVVSGLIVRVSPKNIKTFYFAYKNKEGLKRKYRIDRCDQINLNTARKEASRLKGLVVIGQDPHLERQEVKIELKKSITLEQFLDSHYYPYIESKVANHKRPEKTKKIIDGKGGFKKFYKIPLNKLKKKEFEKWYEGEINRGLTANTINRAFATIRASLNCAIKNGLLVENPCCDIKLLKNSKGVVRYLLDDEKERLFNELDNMKGKIPIIIRLLYFTGCRPIEIFTLKYKNVNLKLKHITIEEIYAKNGKERHVPLNDSACELLIGYIGDEQIIGDTYLFTMDKSKNHIKGMQNQWESLCKRAQLENFRMYDLRHNYASQLCMKGVDLFTVSQLLGHSDTKITTIYAHLSPEHKLQAVNLLD